MCALSLLKRAVESRHWGQAARLLDEVDMEVDENNISAGKLADSEYSEAADKEEDHVS